MNQIFDFWWLKFDFNLMVHAYWAKLLKKFRYYVQGAKWKRICYDFQVWRLYYLTLFTQFRTIKRAHECRPLKLHKALSKAFLSFHKISAIIKSNMYQVMTTFRRAEIKMDNRIFSINHKIHSLIINPSSLNMIF